MFKFCWLAPTLLAGFFLVTSADDSAAQKPYGLEKRIPWTTSRIVGTPEPPPPYTTIRVFPKLKFKNPVFIAQEPDSERIMVAELNGKIFAFTKDRAEPEALQLILDTKRKIYAFSFHPNYAKNGKIYVFSPQPDKSRVSQFIATGEPKCCDAKTEKIIVEWPSGGHNGGEAIFGPDGFLYIATGDSTSTSDEKNTGQGVDDLLSVVMRLDVDNPDPNKAYSIPKDNPFVNVKGARPEIWAFGFRNPWRMSFDRDGRLWVGDVGQDLWEMIRLVRRGGNYGWSVQEGSHPFHALKKPGPGPILPPVVEHHHVECRSITGGYVYYGDKFPELHGAYLYGDYEYGKIWGLRYDPKSAGKSGATTTDGERGRIIHDPNVVWQKELADTALRIATFGLTRDGEILMLDHPSGEIHALRKAERTKPAHPFPRKLSETGLFRSVKEHKVAPGVLPFSVNTPAWMDGATAERFIAMPSDATISVPGNDAHAWSPSDGVVTVQTVSLEMETGNPQSQRRIETRIMVRQQNHWLGYTYLWNDQQTDAELVDALGSEKVFTITDHTAPDGKRRHTWRVPSRNECMFCHSRAAGFVLGLRTIQINNDHSYDGVIDNQLRAFNHIGLFKKPMVEQSLHRPKTKKPKSAEDKHAKDYKALVNAYDLDADLNDRARAYLHVNCSVCHDGSGGGNSKFQIRYDKKIEEANLLGETPMHGDFGLTNGKLIAPGDPYASVLLYRTSKLGAGRMPHIGSGVIDQRGLDLLHDWIRHLTPKGKIRPKRKQSPLEYTAAKNSVIIAALINPALRGKRITTDLFSSPRTAFATSRVVAKENLPKPLRDEIVSIGVAHEDANIRDLFERFIPEEKRTIRLGDRIQPSKILAIKGNIDAGRKFFLAGNASLCRSCHRVGKVGGMIGPDLSMIGKKYTREKILESLLHPSKDIEEKYRTHLLVTTAGRVLTGVVAEKNKNEVVLLVFENGKETRLRIAVNLIEQIGPQPQSLMPEALLRNLTPQQAADLVDYLASLK